MSKDLLDRLTRHRILATIPHEQVAWVAEHGTLHRLETGEVLTAKDSKVAGLHIVLNGHLSIYVDRGAGRRKIMEWRGGDVTGLMRYSRLVSPPGDVAAEEPSDLVTVYRADMPQMIRDCNELTAALVHVMLDRARHFTSSFLHDEKLVSLGKLAAGLAHELNNPASAIARSASSLGSSVDDADSSSRELGAAGLGPEKVALIQGVRDACIARNAQSVLSPLEQEGRERSLSRWLSERHVQPDRAEALAEMGFTRDMLEELARSIPTQSLDASLAWIAASATTRRISAEIQEAASRISNLVDAIKGFTQMDRESVSEPVDVSQGLTNTLVVLRGKAKDKAVSLSLDIASDLPLIHGFAGELNQVWSNLISNALDAVSENGRVQVNARRAEDARGGIIVRVVDDGAGIPPSIRDRIFDPFFTTKPVGEGSGLGLDIVRRLVQRHNGQIEVESSPGRTEFRVILP
jgi:signal transduction histidine kinase